MALSKQAMQQEAHLTMQVTAFPYAAPSDFYFSWC